MIFEEAYGHWLVLMINNQIKTTLGKTCKLYDEVAFKPLRKDPEEIAIIINGGGAARSSVAGQDQNNLSLNVVMICKKEYSKSVRGCVDNFQSTYNAKLVSLPYIDNAGNSIMQRTKSVFFTPITIDSNDYQTEKGTIKATFLSFTVSVVYGLTAISTPSTFKLSIDGAEYDVNYIVQYNISSQPAYDTYLAPGETHPQQRLVSASNAWSLTIAKVANDDLQTLFTEELNAVDGRGLYGKTLTLVRDEQSIPIHNYNLTESYINNAAAYLLVLSY